MKYSEIKEVRAFCDDQSIDDWREVVASINYDCDDFEVDDYRFISVDEIDDIQVSELSGDEYILGCFNAGFIANVLDIDQDAIKAMQEVEAFEAIGKLIISMDKLQELQEGYVSADGYGHHFAHYDHEEHEAPFNYLAFKVN